jgi:methylphosphotriester-DNA--protein-cysteine methyltransferase
VGNKSSKVFHKATCGSVKTMNPANKICFPNREEAIRQGYTPCGNCKP